MAEQALGEFDFIRWLRGRVPADPLVRVGVGDDAAAVANRSDATLVTTDMLVGGTHFDTAEATPRQVGWKALACSVSDIAAMGGEGTAAVVSAALPDGFGRAQARDLVEGMLACCEAFGLRLVGGDLTGTRGPLTLSVTVLGDTGDRPPILRGGARPGDAVMVTGALGGSLLGRHLRFRPRQAEGLILSRRYRPHAMIDVSDGLAIDLHHILEESGVGAALRAETIPIADDARRAAAQSGRTPLDHALGDGEDYELLFTMDLATAERLVDAQPFDVPVRRIGTIVASGATLILGDGSERELRPSGWEHFA
ncbi:MAG: thiamine-phosphate kinase [bacterium]